MAEVKANAAAGKKKAETPTKNLIEPDQILACDSDRQYLVERLIGRGRFGEVYKVSLMKHPEQKFALKLQSSRIVCSRLKTEALIFDEIQKASSFVDKNRFVKMYHLGRTADFKYYLMDLVWLTLFDISNHSLSPSTMMQLARQTLQGIEALHALGYMHRDITPHSFAIGLPPKDHVVYLLDFSSARSYREVKPSRHRDPIIPWWKYASIPVMEGQEPVRKDDIVGWMYIILEFYDKKNLPWRDESDVKVILKKKREQQHNWAKLTKSGAVNAPAHFYWIAQWVMKDLKPQSSVDFPLLFKELTTCAQMENIDEKLPLDWVGKKPKSPEKKEVSKKREKKKGKCNHATQEDVIEKLDAVLSEIEKLKKKKKHRDEENGEEEEDEEDEDSDDDTHRKKGKKKSKSRGRVSRKSSRPRRQSVKRRSRTKEGRDSTNRRKGSAEPATGHETDEMAQKDTQKEVPSPNPADLYTYRKKPARREGHENEVLLKKREMESSDANTFGVEALSKEILSREVMSKEAIEPGKEEFELVSVRGLDADGEWDEKPVAKQASSENVKKADEAAPTKKEPSVDKK